jgi:aminoglycoside phosphotransferase (APT) family kinase protein
MHRDEVTVGVDVMAALLGDQFPLWSHLPIRPVPSSGTDNTMFRLGDELVARLPRRPSAVGSIEREWRWLPMIAEAVRVRVPIPVAMGEPGDGYPFRWLIHRWIDGQDLLTASVDDRAVDRRVLAEDLAPFVNELHQGRPVNGPTSFRGGPVAAHDEHVRRSIDRLVELDQLTHDRADRLRELWARTLELPQWAAPPVWVHADLLAGNLLVLNGRLHAVIDFGGFGVGDPACDLLQAWSLFDPDARARFRSLVDIDDETWFRGQGWALCQGVLAWPYYLDTNPAMVEIGRRAVDEILAEW